VSQHHKGGDERDVPYERGKRRREKQKREENFGSWGGGSGIGSDGSIAVRIGPSGQSKSPGGNHRMRRDGNYREKKRREENAGIEGPSSSIGSILERKRVGQDKKAKTMLKREKRRVDLEDPWKKEEG